MMLSKHFSLAEFCVTQTGLKNEPRAEHMPALLLTAFGFEQVRHILGDEPITFTSAYRNPLVNKHVGGVPDSDHPKGYAGDFKPRNMSAKAAAILLRDSSLVFDQLILERGNSLIHLSFNPRLRRQVLRQPGGPGTQIFAGLD